MKIASIAVVLAVILAGIYIGVFKKTEQLPPVTVLMDKDGFSPSDIVIKKGQTVEFKNIASEAYFWPASDLHPTHELYPEFDPLEPVAPGEVWAFAFKRTGVWKFHDHIKANLRGTVTVTK